MLEASEVKVSSESGGPLVTRPERPGKPVARGSLLATFDTELRDHRTQTADLETRLHPERVRQRQPLRPPLDG